MGNKQKLTKEQILNNKFSNELSGYNATAVDLFLDDILSDYDYFLKKIERLENDLSDYKKSYDEKDEELKQLQINNENLKKQIEELGKNVDYDVVKRIANLEKEIKKNRK